MFIKSAFAPDDQGHGGQRRSWQIRELYAGLGELVPVDEERTIFYSAPRRYWTGLRFLLLNGQSLRSLRHISLTGHKVLNLTRLLHKYPEIRHFVWEPSGDYDDFHIPFLCKRHGARVVAFPHNLESLVPGRTSAMSGRVTPDWFYEEVELFRACDSVVTISTEEQWLLGLYGINCSYLPYFPSRRAVEDLLDIRRSRLEGPLNGPLLMLGTASNSPTAKGMRQVLNWITETRSFVPLVVVGFGTEVLAKEYRKLPNTVSIRGSVAHTELREMLSTCKAVLVFQEASSGALTRIQEMRFAGIPVIANLASLRSYRNIRGLYALTRLEDLLDLSQDELEAPQFSEEAYAQGMKDAAAVTRELLGGADVGSHVVPGTQSRGRGQ